MIDVTEGGRQFISDDFEREEDDENKQYTKSKVEIYIDNKKTKFTRSISEKEFPEEKVYHIKLKFKVLFKNCVGMFVDCGITSIDLSNFDMSKVENMQAMFNSCSNLTSVKFPNANTVNLTNMNYMFSFCDNLTSVNITSLNTKNVEYMNSIFSRCKKLKNLDLSNLDIGKVKDKGLIFYNCYHETSFKLPKGIIKGNVKIIFYCLPYDSFFHEEFVKNNKNKIQLIFKNKEYKLCGSISEIDKDFKDNTIDVKLKVIGALTNLSYMFSGSEISYLGDISKLDTSKVTDMSYLFYENKFVHFDDGFAINWDTSNVKNMSYLFSESHFSEFPDISKWNTSKVTNMKAMFALCLNNPTLPDISKWNVSNVTDMSEMFRALNVHSLPDISKWNTSKVTNMEELFEGVYVEEPPDISKWNTSNVTSMAYMFFNFHCRLGTYEQDNELKDFPDISKWNVGNVTNMDYMFKQIECKKFPDISKWNVSKVKYMNCMFENQDSFNPFKDVSNWDVSQVIESERFFDDCSLKDAKNMDEYLKIVEERQKENEKMWSRLHQN